MSASRIAPLVANSNGTQQPLKEEIVAAMMNEVCSICSGSGLTIVERDGRNVATECACRPAKRSAARLSGSRIPERYQHCTFENFDTSFPNASRSLYAASLYARKFADNYPVMTEGSGLLFTGTIGVGKTHLAVAILQQLVIEKGVKGIFCDYRELLKEIQASYNKQSQTSELDVLAPIFDCEVLVLDELGAVKPTDWVWDTVSLVINSRYNRKRTTIITTNYLDEPATSLSPRNVTPLRAQLAEDTLGDRIGQRMLSRLAEMCVTVSMHGEDYRRSIGRARVGSDY
jgi:DNA replication protein DnaC